LFFEKKVGTFSRLMEELDILDLDSGIRALGDYGGKKRQFVFVTRSPHDTYTLMVYSRRAGRRDPVPGERLLVKEFQRKEELGEFMRNLLSRPLTAFVY
jgi:hypothetical protein